MNGRNGTIDIRLSTAGRGKSALEIIFQTYYPAANSD